MQLPILVEPISENLVRASTGAPLDLRVEAPSRDEAVEKMRQLIRDRIAAGAEVVQVDVSGAQEHPLAPYVGIFKDDPLLEDWKAAMAEYRRQMDSEAVD